MQETVTRQVKIHKVDDDKRIVFAWLWVSETANGETVYDLEGDAIDPPDLEDAAWQFMQESRVGGFEHSVMGVGVVVASLVTTRAVQAVLGLAPGALPVGWLVGIRVTDPQVWAQVKAGELGALSLAGHCYREPVPAVERAGAFGAALGV